MNLELNLLNQNLKETLETPKNSEVDNKKPIIQEDQKKIEEGKQEEDIEKIEKVKNDLLNQFKEENKENEIKIKKGVHLVFEQNPDLANIGTEEQYSEYISNIFPESKITDIVYHGSGQPITSFDKTKIKNPTRGFFFTENRENARIVGESRQSIFRKNNFKLYATVLNIRNPFTHKGRLNRFEILQKPYKNNDSIILTDIEDAVKEKITEYVIFEPDQIHILGSKEDIEQFKKFLSK